MKGLRLILAASLLVSTVGFAQDGPGSGTHGVKAVAQEGPSEMHGISRVTVAQDGGGGTGTHGISGTHGVGHSSQ